MQKRSELRKLIMTILYQIEIMKKNNVNYEVEDIIKDNLLVDNEFVKEIVYGVVTHQNEIDKLADKYLTDWKIERLDKTGASILRMAIFELVYTDTPQIVVIDEAINLAKLYSDESIKSIINALLDRLMKDYER